MTPARVIVSGCGRRCGRRQSLSWDIVRRHVGRSERGSI